MCALSTLVNDDPFALVKIPAYDSLNEPQINDLHPTKLIVLPLSTLYCLAITWKTVRSGPRPRQGNGLE